MEERLTKNKKTFYQKRWTSQRDETSDWRYAWSTSGRSTIFLTPIIIRAFVNAGYEQIVGACPWNKLGSDKLPIIPTVHGTDAFVAEKVHFCASSLLLSTNTAYLDL
jgi:hypothetical protein